MNCCDEYGNCNQGLDCPVRTTSYRWTDACHVTKELPITMDEGGFFDTVDSFIIALRWPLLGFAVVAASLFVVAMLF